MLKTSSQGSGTTVTGLDSGLKPRLKRRGTFEYVAWILCSLLAIGILFSVSTNPNFR